MQVKFWGVRGSVPVPGPSTVKYGGNTTCIQVTTHDDRLIIIDAGTGARLLGLELLKGPFGKGQGEGHILFTHTHWDHIQGFPFFLPAYIGARDDQGNKIANKCNVFHLYGESDVDDRLEATLRGQMEHFYFPVDLGYLSAMIHFHPVKNKPFNIGSTVISARRLIHPNGVLGYRIEDAGKVLVIATDCEHPSDGSIDANLLDLARDADVLVYDTMYTEQEYDPAKFGLKGPSRLGWGHSTPQEGIRLAQACNVKQLVMTHHDPIHDDAKVAEMEQAAQQQFPGASAAFEGLTIDL